MATYTIFAGVNGAGKTSIYKSIYYEKNKNEKRINTDEMVSKIGSWENANLQIKCAREAIKLTEKYINIHNWNNDKYPPFPIVKKIKFKEAEDEVTLRAMAKESIKTIGLSKVNIEVDFIGLRRTKCKSRVRTT